MTRYELLLLPEAEAPDSTRGLVPPEGQVRVPQRAPGVVGTVVLNRLQ